MTLILNKKYVLRSDIPIFYENRALRIYVPYLALLAVAVALSTLQYFTSHQGVFAVWSKLAPDTISSVYIAFCNLFLFGIDTTNFVGIDHHALATQSFAVNDEINTGHLLFIRQAWTLGVELMFYAIAPFIVRRGIRFIVALLAFCIGLRYGFAQFGFVNDPWSYRFFPFELAMFLLGALAYKVGPYIPQFTRKMDYFILSVVFALIALYPIYKASSDDFFAVPKIVLFLVFAATLPVIFRATCSSKVDRSIGDLSYPLYLCHLIVLAALSKIHVLQANTTALAAFGIIGSVALAMVVTRFIERPLDDYRERLYQTRSHQEQLARTFAVQPQGANAAAAYLPEDSVAAMAERAVENSTAN